VRNGVTVPAAAVQAGPDGRFVYVVRSDNTVDLRTVTVTQTENNTALIGSGVSAGERIVTSGWFRLTPGAKVVISNDKNPTSATKTVGSTAAGAK
jgi:membrane fusion protein, multidrug efflux system